MAPAALGERRRLVLAFPSMAVPQPAIDSAAQLARFLRASLLGLYIEDTRLLAAASLPFARQFDASLRAWGPLSHDRLLEDYAAVAAALRRRLRQSAEASGVQAEFAVFRGEPGAMVAAGTAPTDIVALFETIATWPRRLPGKVAGTVFVPRDSRPRPGPIVAVAGAAQDLGVDLASRIAADANLSLVVVDAVQEHSSAFWLGRGSAINVALTAPPGMATSGANFLRSGLPNASLVVLTRATLERLETRLLSIAAKRPEPWLVLEDH